MRNHFIRRLTELALSDRNIILITGDLGFRVLDEFRENCPNQFINVGVAEQNMIGVATGMALEGKIVFVYSIANFGTLRCLEQIRNDACYHRANVNIVSIGGGFGYGALGMSHHATEDLAIMRSIPELRVLAPGDYWEAAEVAEALVRKSGPAFVRIDKSAADRPHREDEVFELGKARVVREGKDLTLMTCGGIIGEVLKAADRLAGEGIHTRVLSIHTIKPLDTKSILLAARETDGILTIEEHSLVGGLGSAIGEVLLDHNASLKKFARIGIPDCFASVVGSQDYLRRSFGLDDNSILEKARQMVRTPVELAHSRVPHLDETTV